MDLHQARLLIRRGEGANVEFKKKSNHPEKIIREVVAFANTDGGHLFIGVDDSGLISGLKYPDEDEFELTKAIKELCRPVLDFGVEKIRFEDNVVILHFDIPSSNSKPHFAFLKKSHRYGKAFVRVNDRSIQASYEVRKFLEYQEKEGRAFTYEETTAQLFNYFEEHSHITLSEYQKLTGMNKRLASSKLVGLALSGALKIDPQEGEDLFLPTE